MGHYVSAEIGVLLSMPKCIGLSKSIVENAGIGLSCNDQLSIISIALTVKNFNFFISAASPNGIHAYLGSHND